MRPEGGVTVERKKRMAALLLRWLPAAAVAAIVLLALRWRDCFSLETLLALAPEEALPAALFLLLLFALKSLSIVFPILVLYALSGLLFPIVPAILLNLAGTAAALLLPYGLGRLAGTELAEGIFRRWPKARRLRDFQWGSPWFFSFFLRMLGFLPGDVVSMYLGASRLPWRPCLFGGLAGMFPALLAGTLLGDSLADPSSPLFWVGAGGMAALSVLSMLLYRRWVRKTARPRNRRKDDDHDETRTS